MSRLSSPLLLLPQVRETIVHNNTVNANTTYTQTNDQGQSFSTSNYLAGAPPPLFFFSLSSPFF